MFQVGEILLSRAALPLSNPRLRKKRGESNLWQRRFWEHLIRDEQDFATHFD